MENHDGADIPTNNQTNNDREFEHKNEVDEVEVEDEDREQVDVITEPNMVTADKNKLADDTTAQTTITSTITATTATAQQQSKTQQVYR